ncbi:hypothetical protein [Acinetobacter sp.]|uniref:hypothetical protein n=1 Tax=Acinetobacter sp. TaxID=472 RepID=UPI00289B62FF|nr:hypothetical protein [Acinetobacter sp.]
MNEIETNGYLICSKCNSTNRVVEIGRQGVYKCGTCRNDLLVINKEKKGSKIIPLLVISIFVGVVGGFGIDQVQEKLKPTEIIYSELNTSWSDWQIEAFDRSCKAKYSQLKPNWSSEKIAKICTCYVSYIVEKTDYPRSGKLSNVIANEGIRECR